MVVVANLGRTATSPALTLALSTLPTGTYQVTELLSGQAAGTITLDAQGAFSSWALPLPALAANQTWVLNLTSAVPAATGAPAVFAPQLYPNPAAQQVRLELPGPAAVTQLRVYDLQGRLLRTTRFAGRRHTLDTSSWANGTYFLRIQSGPGVSVQRLVVAH